MDGSAAWFPEAVHGLVAAAAFAVLFLGARLRWRERGGDGGDSGLD